MAEKRIVLAPETELMLKKMGQQIKRARLRRDIRAGVLAEQAKISQSTLTAIEKGMPTVSIGAYAVVLQLLELANDFELIAMDEEGKKNYEESVLYYRERATKQKRSKVENI